jgi:hypothetical protein
MSVHLGWFYYYLRWSEAIPLFPAFRWGESWAIRRLQEANNDDSNA